MRKIIFPAMLLFVLVANAQNSKAPDVERVKFIAQAKSTLASRITEDQSKDLNSKIEKWASDKSKKNWLSLIDTIHELSIHLSLPAKVDIKSLPTNGAQVLYQTENERKRHQKTTAHGPTGVVEDMYLGEYYMWTERGTNITSNTNRLYLIGASTAIQLQEENER